MARYEPYADHDTLGAALQRRERLRGQLLRSEARCAELEAECGRLRKAVEEKEAEKARVLGAAARFERNWRARQELSAQLAALQGEHRALQAEHKGLRADLDRAAASRADALRELMRAQTDFQFHLECAGALSEGALARIRGGLGAGQDEDSRLWRTCSMGQLARVCRLAARPDVRLPCGDVWEGALRFTSLNWDMFHAFHPCPTLNVLQARYPPGFDGLRADWVEHSACCSSRVWLNPPHAEVPLWMSKACAAALKGVRVLVLLLRLEPREPPGGSWTRHCPWFFEVFEFCEKQGHFLDPRGGPSQALQYRLLDLAPARALRDPRVEQYAAPAAAAPGAGPERPSTPPSRSTSPEVPSARGSSWSSSSSSPSPPPPPPPPGLTPPPRAVPAGAVGDSFYGFEV